MSDISIDSTIVSSAARHAIGIDVGADVARELLCRELVGRRLSQLGQHRDVEQANRELGLEPAEHPPGEGVMRRASRAT